MGKQTEKAQLNSCRTVGDSTTMFLASNRIEEEQSHNTPPGFPIGVLVLTVAEPLSQRG